MCIRDSYYYYYYYHMAVACIVIVVELGIAYCARTIQYNNKRSSAQSTITWQTVHYNVSEYIGY